jgi:predicted small lipoprotein YifL
MRNTLITLLAAVLLGGCGYKGPLYLPKPKPEAQQPAPKAAPAQDDRKPDAEPKKPGPDSATSGPGRGTESQ